MEQSMKLIVLNNVYVYTNYMFKKIHIEEKSNIHFELLRVNFLQQRNVNKTTEKICNIERNNNNNSTKIKYAIKSRSKILFILTI